MTRVRIIGIGSPLGDDQIGWRLVDFLRNYKSLQTPVCEISLFALDRPGVQLIEQLLGADIVVLIDAIKSGAAPGTLYRVANIGDLEKDLLVSSHGFGVAAALELAAALDVLPEKLLLYGVEIGDAGFASACGSVPDDAVAEAAAGICADLAELIAVPA